MTDWRFYGRVEEMNRLEEALQLQESKSRGFYSVRIVGRRGVGKTELLAEAGRRGTRNAPVLICELPSGGDGTQAVVDLVATIERGGMEHLLADLPQVGWDRDPGWRFLHIVDHLICKGTVVGLDEFHNAERSMLVTPIKRLIDEYHSIGGRKPTGKLVLMGSHQQQMLRLFQPDQPLYGRADVSVKLHQWPPATVLEMAAEHGILAHPNRFLTLWTAYGGVPKQWHRFADGLSADGVNAQRLGAWPDERRWRLAFLDAEQQVLRSDPEERFDNRAFIELAEPHREVLLWMGRRRPKGAAVQDFPQELRQRAEPTLQESLNTLDEHLELIEQDGEFLERGNRWRVSENSTMFQICVLQMPPPGASGPLAISDSDRIISRMETLEGQALERFAAGWLAGLPGVSWTGFGIWRRGLPDIDVMAVQGEGRDQTLVLGGCKRNADAHDTALLARQFSQFLESTGNSEQARQLRELPRRRILVSPKFTAVQRRRFAASGFECVDIPDMARSLEIDPNPKQPPEPKTAFQPKLPDPNDGPSFDM